MGIQMAMAKAPTTYRRLTLVNPQALPAGLRTPEALSWMPARLVSARALGHASNALSWKSAATSNGYAHACTYRGGEVQKFCGFSSGAAAGQKLAYLQFKVCRSLQRTAGQKRKHKSSGARTLEARCGKNAST
jgi:hypothetical protein